MDKFITETMNNYIDQILAKKSRNVEWVNEFAVPVAVTVICKIIGFPISDFPKIKKFSNAIAYFIGTVTTSDSELDAKCNKVHQTFVEMVDYTKFWIAHYRKNPSDCFISNTLHDSNPEAREITEHHGENLFIFHIIDLMFAGHGNISNLLAGGLVQLLLPQNRKHFEELKKDSGLAPEIVEEMVRLVSPTHRLSRVVKEDLRVDERGGTTTITTGQVICINLLKANYDPEHFPNPSELDPSRASAPTKHIAFGYGGHLCVGRNLARLQAKIMLCLVARRLPNLAYNDVGFGTNATFRIVENTEFTF